LSHGCILIFGVNLSEYIVGKTPATAERTIHYSVPSFIWREASTIL
jgi:hypothetical protein